MNEGYAPHPVRGLPWSTTGSRRLRAVLDASAYGGRRREGSGRKKGGGGGGRDDEGEDEWSEADDSRANGVDDDEEEEDDDDHGGGDEHNRVSEDDGADHDADSGSGRDGGGDNREVGPLSQGRSAEEVMVSWGKSLALSVETPHGLCPGGSGCSGVWMYGSVAWGALRERCRRAAAGLLPPPPLGGVGGEGQREVEALEVACAVGDIASRTPDAWGLRGEHVCGAGPGGEVVGAGGGGGAPGGGKWKRARVWSVGRYRRSG